MVPGHCGNVSSAPFRFTFCGRCPGSWDQVGVVFFRFFVRPRQKGTTLSAFYSSAGFGEVQRKFVGFEVGWGLREFQRKLKGFEVFVQYMFVNRLRPVRPRRDDLVGPNTLLLCSTDVRCGEFWFLLWYQDTVETLPRSHSVSMDAVSAQGTNIGAQTGRLCRPLTFVFCHFRPVKPNSRDDLVGLFSYTARFK